jgi:hypothetical protein
VSCKDGSVRALDLGGGGDERILLGAPKQPDPPGLKGGGPAGLAFLGDEPDQAVTIALAPDGRTLAVLHSEGPSVALWELASGRERARLKPPSGPVTALRFSADGRYLVTAGEDGTMLVWAVGAVPGKAAAAPGAQELEALWGDLGGDDAGRAFQAVQRLTAAPGLAVDFLKGRLNRVAGVDAALVRDRIRALDSTTFARRQKAEGELIELGELVLPEVRQALESKPSAEAKSRLETIVKRLAGGAVRGEGLRGVRAVEALEYLGGKEAREVLRALASGAAGARLTREARAALARLDLREARQP